jgi:hypothetical protein
MFDSKVMPKLSDPSEITDLDERLGLYRVFLKLYEHHRGLLDEILELENSDHRYRTYGNWQFVQGVIQRNHIHLITNLLDEKTQMLIQPQNCWVIGRDRHTSIPIPDKRLSRRHALVQYVASQGFYLMDLNSTNGSYVNGEPVRRPVLLKDGDRVRLGSLSFMFFLCQGSRQSASISTEVLQSFGLNQWAADPPTASQVAATHLNEGNDDQVEVALPSSDRETYMFLQSSDSKDERAEVALPDLSNAQKAEILDRFLKR